MKTSGMPTVKNTTPLESYADYKERKFESVIDLTKQAIILIKNSSLTEGDKKLALLQIEFDVKKATI
jgi:hypothetical protein